ncbi:MAG: hypothetical protein R3D00_25035 [Bacteroidia bacterium]
MKAKKINKWVREIKTLNKKLAKIERILEEQLSKSQPVEVVESTETVAMAEIPAPEVVVPEPKKRGSRTVKTTKTAKTPAAKTTTPTKRRGRPAQVKSEAVTVVETPANEVVSEAPVKRRGRPAALKKATETVADTPAAEVVAEAPVKRRGRPVGWKKPVDTTAKTPVKKVSIDAPVKRRGRPAGWKKPVSNTEVPLVESSAEKVQTQSKRSSGWKRTPKNQA